MSVQRRVGDLKLTAADLSQQRHDRALGQPAGAVLERADRQQQLKEPIESARVTRILVTEQFTEPVLGHAARAQPAVIGGGLIPAAPAHVVRRNASALAADRRLTAVIAHQPPLLTTPRTAALRVKRTVIARAAHRPLGPLRGRAAPLTAVRAGLRTDRRAGAAQHLATAHTSARADLPAVLTPSG